MLKKVRTGVSFNLSNTSKKQGVMNALQNQNMKSDIFISICGRLISEQNSLQGIKTVLTSKHLQNCMIG